jgi:hypothetical protein
MTAPCKAGRDTRWERGIQFRSLLLGLSILLTAEVALSGEGGVDLSFGTAGRMTSPPGFHGMTVMPDGGLQFYALANGRLRVARMTSDGRPDSAFGDGSIAESPLAVTSSDLYYLASRNEDGSVLLALRLPTESATDARRFDLALTRVTREGVVDTQFGTRGLVMVPSLLFPNSDFTDLEEVAQTPEGRIYILLDDMVGGGYGCVVEQRIYSLEADGSPARIFSGNPAYVLSRPRQGDCLDPGGGALWSLPGDRVIVQHLLGNTLIESGNIVAFPSSALVPGGPGHSGMAGRDGDALISAVAVPGSATRFQLQRWNSDLSRDLSFGSSGDGSIAVDFGGLLADEHYVWDVRVLRSRTANAPWYVVAGLARPPRYGTMPLGRAVLRLDAAGRIDRSFGDEGIQLLDSHSSYAGVALQGEANLIFSPPGASGSFRLAGHDAASPGLIEIGTYLCYGNGVRENAGHYTVNLRRLLGTSGAVSVRYWTQGVSATPGSDYDDVEGLLQWGDGDAGIRSFDIPILADATAEGPEQIQIQFERVAGTALLACDAGNLTISDAAAPITTSPPNSTTSPPTAPSPSSPASTSMVPPPTPQSASSGVAGSVAGGGGSVGPSGLLLLLLVLLLRRRELLWSEAQGAQAMATICRQPIHAAVAPPRR